jgi:hypothetical protein
MRSANRGMSKNCPRAVPEIATPDTNPRKLINHLERVDEMTPMLIPDTPIPVITP